MSDFSKDKLLEFLDFLGNKGMMNKSTVAARKAATNTLLGILSPDEAGDLRDIDLDSVALRFINLKGSEFKPESVNVYKSRVRSALSDLQKYRANPLSYKPSATFSKQTPAKSDPDKDGSKPILSTNTCASWPSEITFPVPIRSNVIVRIVGLPSDLTQKEASRIANVVLALATDEAES